MKEKICVVLPTRGLVFSEVMEAIECERVSCDIRVFYSWDKKIPEGHNELTRKALRAGADYIWFIEEDTVCPLGGLKTMLSVDGDIVCIDYGVNGYSCVTKDRDTRELLTCGLGCTLVKRKVFDTLEMPYFRSDIQLLINNYPEEQWIPASNQAYGGQDIYFCIMARKAGFTIKKVEGMEARHLRLDSLGRPEINKGLHAISQKPKISKYQYLPI